MKHSKEKTVIKNIVNVYDEVLRPSQSDELKRLMCELVFELPMIELQKIFTVITIDDPTKIVYKVTLETKD